MGNEETLIATAGMLIRAPAAAVYEAFVDPTVTARFWFTAGSARLDAAGPITWTWAMYGHSTTVRVEELVPGRRILIEWDVGTERASMVEWAFSEIDPASTFVDVRNYGFRGSPEARAAQAIDSAGGFALVLAGAKAWLESGLQLGLIEGRHPHMLVEDWRA